MANPEEVALLLGSGNLTQCGFMTNAELFDGVYLSAEGTNRILISDILRFLDGLRAFWEDRPELLVLETLQEVRDAVAQFDDNTAGAPEEYKDARFFTSFGGPLVDQLRE